MATYNYINLKPQWDEAEMKNQGFTSRCRLGGIGNYYEFAETQYFLIAQNEELIILYFLPQDRQHAI